MQLPDIERWIPNAWEDVVGNAALKEHLQDQLHALRTGRSEKGVNTYVKGPSRSGKTSTARFFARCLLCEKLDLETLNPCGQCYACKEGLDRFGDSGVFANIRGREVHFMPIDCMQVRGAEHLRDLIHQMVDFDGVKVVLLDEMSRLVKRDLDEILLGPLQTLNYMWVGTSIETDRLDHAVYGRFPAKFTTALPSDEQLTKLLMRRCVEWKIPYDSPSTLLQLSGVASRLPGVALHALAQVNIKRGEHRKVTREFVESYRERLMT